MKTLKEYCPFSYESYCERLIRENVMTLGGEESETGGFFVGKMELELERV